MLIKWDTDKLPHNILQCFRNLKHRSCLLQKKQNLGQHNVVNGLFILDSGLRRHGFIHNLLPVKSKHPAEIRKLYI